MKVRVMLDAAVFRRFTTFDILKRRKLWKSPVIFAAILSASAAVCFIMHRVRGAVFLGIVLLVVGLGVPVTYFSTFFLSLRKQIRINRLERPREVYTLVLTEVPEGIHVENEAEAADYPWDKTFHAYRDREAVYLYMTPDRAFILPDSSVSGDPEELWALLERMLGPEKCTLL